MNRRLQAPSFVGLWFGLVLWFLAQLAFAQSVPVPQLSARATDLTGTFSATELAQLENKLKTLEDEKGAQLVVLMLPTVQPDTVDSFARRVFDQWKIGRQKVDDGILYLIAKDDRRQRIEVGYGLEGAVPDILASRILNDTVAPHFRHNDYVTGINRGVDQLISLIHGESLAPISPSTDTLDKVDIVIIILFAMGMGISIAVIVASISQRFYEGPLSEIRRKGGYFGDGRSSSGGGYFGGGGSSSGGGYFGGGGGSSGGGGASGDW